MENLSGHFYLCNVYKSTSDHKYVSKESVLEGHHIQEKSSCHPILNELCHELGLEKAALMHGEVFPDLKHLCDAEGGPGALWFSSAREIV